MTWVVICREIYRFQESLQDESIIMDYLIIPDKAEIPNGLVTSTASIVHVSSIVMRKLSGLQSTDSVDAIALIKIPDSVFNLDGDQNNCYKWFPSAHRILVLDGIQVTCNFTSKFNILGHAVFAIWYCRGAVLNWEVAPHSCFDFCLINIIDYFMTIHFPV